MLNLEFKQTIELIDKAYEKVLDIQIFEMWLSLYPNMKKENFISLEEYRNKVLINNNISNVSDEEILEEVREIRERAKKKGG